MSEGLLRSIGNDQVQVFSAGMRADGVHPMAIEVMKEIGIDLARHTSKTIKDLGNCSFDLIITLCAEAQGKCDAQGACYIESHEQGCENSALTGGMPVRLHWPIPDPADFEGEEEAIRAEFRAVRDLLESKLRDLLALGYLKGLMRERRRIQQLLDAMDDGIIVHDSCRNIFLFNKAAERITGFTQDEVVGHNCHGTFKPDGLCGSQCPLDGDALDSFSGDQYEVTFNAKDGVQRRIKMTSSLMQLEEDEPPVVLATFRDITEMSQLRWDMKRRYSFHGLVGMSQSMQEVFRTIRDVAASDYPVLITGESGTGKELVSRAIHNESRRNSGPFVPINCGALPENILESELFGHVRGAFTGAIREKKGRFELAHKGTLFLDEVGELSPAFQVKLLRVLEERCFEMVGGERTIHVDVRLISATNRDLQKMIAERTFRDDLFYRLRVVPIILPPLRERTEDLPLLTRSILKRIRNETGKAIEDLDNEVMDLLVSYNWPGNIRELINVLQFASVRCTSERIESGHLPLEIRANNPALVSPSTRLGEADKQTPRRRKKLNLETVERALAETGGNKVKAAKLLGVGRATLYRFMDEMTRQDNG